MLIYIGFNRLLTVVYVASFSTILLDIGLISRVLAELITRGMLLFKFVNLGYVSCTVWVEVFFTFYKKIRKSKSNVVIRRLRII